MFRDYLVDETQLKGDVIYVSYTPKDIEKIEGVLEEERSPGYVEYTCIMDKIASDLPNHGMFLMHGAVIEYNGKAYIFTAPSGTGKSTHISLWKKYLGDKIQIINGDKPEVSFDDTKVYVHGAPWCGKEGWQTNTSAELAGVCVVNQSKNNAIKTIHPGNNIEFFLTQIYIGTGEYDLLKVVDLFTKMAERVSFYSLDCDISEAAAKCSFETMTGENWGEAKQF